MMTMTMMMMMMMTMTTKLDGKVLGIQKKFVVVMMMTAMAPYLNMPKKQKKKKYYHTYRNFIVSIVSLSNFTQNVCRLHSTMGRFAYIYKNFHTNIKENNIFFSVATHFVLLCNIFFSLTQTEKKKKQKISEYHNQTKTTF